MKYLIFLTALVLISCGQSYQEKHGTMKGFYERTDSSKGLWGDASYCIEEKTIDSCQYIIIFGMNGRNIIHKANCKNKHPY